MDGIRVNPYVLYQRVTLVVGLFLMLFGGGAGFGAGVLTIGIGLIVLLLHRSLEETRQFRLLVVSLQQQLEDQEDQKAEARNKTEDEEPELR